jgi:tetratricopeptide (TPR) repeat protein
MNTYQFLAILILTTLMGIGCEKEISGAVFAQDADFQLSQWKSKLTIKEDPWFAQWHEVFMDIYSLGQPKCCEALELLSQQQGRRGARYQIRLALLIKELNHYDCKCPGHPDEIELLQKAFRQAHELDDNLLVTQVNLSLGHSYYAKGKLSLSVMHYLIARKMMEEEGLELFRNYAYTLYFIADLQYRVHDYPATIQFSRQALEYRGSSPSNAMDSLDNYWRMNAWNVQGLAYKYLEEYDSAFYAFDQAYRLAHDDFWRGLLQGNRGDLYFLQGQYDSARVLLEQDYEQSLADQEFDNASISLQRLASITNANGDHAMALKMLDESNALEHKSPNGVYRMQILHAYATIYKDLGLADSVFVYLEQYKELGDKIDRYTADNRTEIARLHLDSQEKIQEIMTLSRDKRRIKLIRNFTVGIILLLASLAYVDFRRQKLKIQLQKQEALESQRRAEQEVSHAKEKLTEFTANILEKSKLIEHLQSQLMQRETTAEQHQMIIELSHQQLLTDADWDDFKSLFEQVYPGFFISIREKAADITLAELRMAALIKLQLTTKESAALLGVSLDTIHKTRQRLKQRLQLRSEEDLDQEVMVHG